MPAVLCLSHVKTRTGEQDIAGPNPPLHRATGCEPGRDAYLLYGADDEALLLHHALSSLSCCAPALLDCSEPTFWSTPPVCHHEASPALPHNLLYGESSLRLYDCPATGMGIRVADMRLGWMLGRRCWSTRTKPPATQTCSRLRLHGAGG